MPRDAYAQEAAVEPVALGNEQPGDLYFFAREGGRVFHVGFVTGERTMLHAPEDRRADRGRTDRAGAAADARSAGRPRLVRVASRREALVSADESLPSPSDEPSSGCRRTVVVRSALCDAR